MFTNCSMNKEMIAGLRLIVQGLASFVEGLAIMNDVADTEEVIVTPAPSVTVPEEVTPVVTPTVEDEVTDDSDEDTETVIEEVAVEESKDNSSILNSVSEEKLKSMTYNDLKKLAKSLNVTAVGTRNELISKILNAVDSADIDEPEDEDADIEPVKAVPPVVEVVDEEEDDEEPDEDDIEANVLSAVEDWTDDDIRDLLVEYGISNKGKRQALISKLVTAVREGIIEFSEDEDEDEESKPDYEDDEVPFDNEQSEGGDVTSGMTPERKKAYEELCDDTTNDFRNGDTTRKELIDFLNDFNNENNKYKGVSDEDILATYLEVVANLVSDEGEVVEEGAYTVNDIPFCCGRPLEYDKKNKVYHCSCCDSDYEADE